MKWKKLRFRCQRMVEAMHVKLQYKIYCIRFFNLGTRFVSDVLVDGQWHWPPTKSDSVVSIQAGLFTKLIWNMKILSGDCLPLQAGKPAIQLGMILRASISKWIGTGWFDLVLESLSIMHSFILWLAIKDRLCTWDGLTRWGIYLCRYCRSHLECREQDILWVLLH